ncbi:CDP-glucose 4,6-dehydratase [Flagellimonas flava]|uniref:CDP-glucose 4,6-dehydratase n=1 Tax=Flagellimonas flava TaxID=570519 RepID=A0A1M5J7A4_9FLAO|nr:CDP-glucose 4,6-dehydratase [Allomuricauda flava]SHG36381.1 CDP-glucose 4,6-dehydratase [Allomuricauda flava]
MEISELFSGAYKGRKCLVTGDSGFKGSWLVAWLTQMGAEVKGYALAPVTTKNHKELLQTDYEFVEDNILNYDSLKSVFEEFQPEIVFHLAAQALVKYSYDNPIETYQTNVIGTLNIFEISRQTASVKAIVNVTSDKCYENREWIWGYRENDAMGGHDPYSSSKGCAELLTQSYRKSFFDGKGKTLLASGRAGNVIGGGDWSQDRLIPDLVKAAAIEGTTEIRNPLATRPWQHVLDPISGYLMLGWKLLRGEKEFAEGWNFGPDLSSNLSVREIADEARSVWSKIEYTVSSDKNNHHEANLLMLDCSKSNKLLKWTPVWDRSETIRKTIMWYKDFYESGVVNTEEDITQYVRDAVTKNKVWTL